jgi:hypothetical protein
MEKLSKFSKWFFSKPKAVDNNKSTDPFVKFDVAVDHAKTKSAFALADIYTECLAERVQAQKELDLALARRDKAAQMGNSTLFEYMERRIVSARETLETARFRENRAYTKALNALSGGDLDDAVYVHYVYSRPQDKVRDAVPALREIAPCPRCHRHGTLWRTIQHLNDRHMWSRGMIADWIETLDLDIEFKTQGENNEQD